MSDVRPARSSGTAMRGHAQASGCRVIVCDPASRRARIALACVAECGAAIAEANLPPHLALVAIQAAEEDAALDEIRHRQVAGQIVLAYADGADAWPLSRKCRPLIAGARTLLDSASAAFAGALRSALHANISGLVARIAEERELRERLSVLGLEGGRGPAMLEVFRHVVRFAGLGDLPVLLTGETGTGKERVARALHRCDPRRSRGPFVAVNCGALVSTLAESELFGHRRGAFTGAERARPGLVRAADGGVLFLDEIGELEPALQTKLLRVVQEGRVLGVGEEEEVAVDVRIVAATHRDLPTLVASGRFRADLLHRLAVLPLHLPPLRERPEDLPVLVAHLLDRYRRLHPAALQPPDSELLEALGRLRLEGNVRQLENILRQALVHKRGEGPLVLADLPASTLAELAASASASAAGDIQPPAKSPSPAPPVRDPAVQTAALPGLLVALAEAHQWDVGSCLRACEREVFAAALARMSGNQTRAAGLLGLSPRCVYNKLRKLGLRAD